MKKILILIPALTAVVLLGIITESQSKDVPDGFIGLKWGHSLAKMKEEMLLYSVKIDDKNPDKSIAIIDLNRFNPFRDLKISGIGLSFYKDKLYGGSILVKNLKDWKLLCDVLKEKYGEAAHEEMKNVYGKTIGVILNWDFGIGVGRITSKFNQLKDEGIIHYTFPPKELMDDYFKEQKEDRGKVKDKL